MIADSRKLRGFVRKETIAKKKKGKLEPSEPDVPVGGEDSSAMRKEVGSPREFSFPIKDHLQLGKDLDLIDFDSAAEVSGSKFFYLKNEAILLEMAILSWTLSQVMKKGFTPLTTLEIFYC